MNARCALLSLMFAVPLVADEAAEKKPTIQDLDFLVGTWRIRFEIYDTHQPDRGVLFVEEGTQTCRYDLPLNGEPKFIVCDAELEAQDGSESVGGRSRTFRESIRYNQFLGSFERIGHFSNWPSHSEERVFYHPDRRELETRGRLAVQDGLMERYEDIYTFSEDHRSYQRRNVANFSDMRETVYRLTLAGTGQRID